MERSLRRCGPTHSSGEVGLALCLLDGSELTCESGSGQCKTIQVNALKQLNSSPPSRRSLWNKTGSVLGLALFSGAVTLSAGSRRDSGTESYRLWEDCRSVLENLKDEIQ